MPASSALITHHDLQVVRVTLNALKNLLLAPDLDVGPDMVETGLPKVVAQRKQQVRHGPLLAHTLLRSISSFLQTG